jgi:hypothetical protein
LKSLRASKEENPTFDASSAMSVARPYKMPATTRTVTRIMIGRGALVCALPAHDAEATWSPLYKISSKRARD